MFISFNNELSMNSSRNLNYLMVTGYPYNRVDINFREHVNRYNQQSIN